ncbi:MAG: hypothetical protein NTZ32_13410 [Planctomycetales bacterium]|nr:hypothetical protein [Planctomycetales bacterium]
MFKSDGDQSFSWRTLQIVIVTAATFVVGCGGASSGPLVKTVPVTGKVFLGQKPLSGAAVLLTPVQGTKGAGGIGVTDAEGRFMASVDQKRPGVEPGTYVVTFTKWAQKDGSPIPAGKTAADVEAIQVIPEAYSNPSIEFPKNVVTIDKAGGDLDLQIPATN